MRYNIGITMSNKYPKTIFYLTLAGSLFSGYLSAKKLFTNTCSFNETCPYFLGYPACLFGFGLFFIMLIIAILGLTKTITLRIEKISITIISFLGILFAGQFVIPEINLFINQTKPAYGLLLPTCAYGLIFFIIIFITSLWPKKFTIN